MTVKEAAQTIGISVSLCYGLLAAKKIRHYRIGLRRGRIVVPAEAVAEFLQDREVPVEDTPSSPRTFSHLS